MAFAMFLTLAVVALSALFGLGGVFCRIVGYHAGSRTEVAGIGMAFLLFAGGVLNLFRVSYGWVYDLLLVVGVVAAFSLAPPIQAFTATLTRGRILTAALVIVPLWLLGHSQLPPSAFNYQDDFEKYFVHPVRMLQTGTLFGSPLSAIGAETLGGQAVLHGVVMRHAAAPYLFAVDSLFALGLCLMLLLTATPGGRLLPAVLSVAFLISINPMMINVSATYTTCALVMTSLLVCSSLKHKNAECRMQTSLPLVLGLVFAALVSLKTINALYVAVLFAIAAPLQWTVWRKQVPSAGSMNLLATMGATFFFMLPWLLLHLPNYLKVPSAIDSSRFSANEPPYHEPMNLLSFDRLFYGSSYAHFTLLALVVVIYCVALYFLLRPHLWDHASSRWLIACGLAIPLSAALILGLGPQLNGYFVNIRYATPFLIAGSMLLPVLWGEAEKEGSCRKSLCLRVGVGVCAVMVVAIFSGNFVSRVRQATQFGNSLSFSELATGSDYLEYNRSVLYDGKAAEQMRKVQVVVPQGASILAWVTTPYHLDFSRNRIYDVEQAGVGNPWANIPDAEYVMYQYAGYAVPSVEVIYEDLRHPGRRERLVGRNALYVIQWIEKLWNESQEIYNDGEIAVFKVRRSRAGEGEP